MEFRRAVRDPRWGSFLLLVGSGLVAFNFFITESWRFRLIFTAGLFVFFASLVTVVVALALPVARVSERDIARGARVLQGFAAIALVLAFIAARVI